MAGSKRLIASVASPASPTDVQTGSTDAAIRRPILGWTLVLLAVVLWMLLVFSTLFAKALPETGTGWIDWARDDKYFCHLLPMTVPSLLFFRYWNWLSMELFKNA
eukprot:TRINITY_DN123075_c0_g1_i1.p1 TRINITY_DN123075_c0_g1~~TRINITY_DN123075_c0_g1_i1.p1  ORF type:complete len:105 (+),score=30.89 TRINITY_DN123075_c0_g1_i1:68-382(+)